MKRFTLFSGFFLAILLFALPGLVSAYTKAVVGFPVLGENGLSEDIYVYACADATCEEKNITQLEVYGHITNVPRWPKGVGGPGGPALQTWAFLPLTDNEAQYFQFWQDTDQGWQSCILGITADGRLDTATTCVGTVATPAQGADGVPSFTEGAAMFANATCQNDPPNKTDPSQTNTLPSRSLTFINGTSAPKICLQTDSSFEHDECSKANPISQKSAGGEPFVIDSSSFINGYNSGVGQVAAFEVNGNWTNTGMGTSSVVYATNMEWTVWPQHSQHTMGPSFIDISLVNGFNVGATLSPNQDTVCSIADTEGGVPYFVMYKANIPMAVFPDTMGPLEHLCPQENVAPINGADELGCYSPCSYAKYYNNGTQDQMCCSGGYNTPSQCTAPPNQPYVQDVDNNSTRVYSWAFNDWRGTFTCEPTASFTFKITDAYSLDAVSLIRHR
jgi:hypothetical protein